MRGHDETDQSLNRGNFLELLELMSRSSPDLKRHLQGRTHYTSPSSQNAMISLIGDVNHVQLILSLILCTPVTSANAERSFSALKRLKTWLRTRMSDDRLCSLALMTFEKELTADLEANVEDLVLQFADITDQRMPLV